MTEPSLAARIFQPGRWLLYATLLCGAALFAFPFMNMLFTSVKLDDEMATENFRLLPKEPVPRLATPYVNDQLDEEIVRPEDLPKETWEAFEGPYRELLRERAGAWWDGSAMVKTLFSSEGVKREEGVEMLVRVVGSRTLARLTDESRKAGAPAMLGEAKRLADETAFAEAFTLVVPRFVLGEVRVRLSDFSRVPLGRSASWVVKSGPVSLKQTVSPMEPGAMLTADFGKSGEDLVLRFVPEASDTKGAFDATKVDRVFVSMQQDRSWATLGIRVTRGGKVYQMKEPLNSEDLRWGEVELRWPDPEKDSVAGRTYRILEELGTAGPGEEDFAVELVVRGNSTVGAWYAKATRNYFTAFRQVPIARYLMTSLALAILNIVLTVFASSLVAYAFARIEFPGRDFLFALLLATMMIPGQVTMIPSFLIYRGLGWYNTPLPLWLPSAFGSAFFIFMMRQFLKTLPKELEEAARIDGCGFLRIYWYVMLPLIRPSLIAVAMFSFQGSWNNFMGPLIYINDQRMYNMAFGLFQFQLQSGSSNSLMMAGAFVMTLPIIVMFFFFQRYFVQGITLTGVGGK